MCGRFTLRAPDGRKIDRINWGDYQDLVPRYNIAPTQDVLTVVERDAHREATFLQWGLIPFWSKRRKESSTHASRRSSKRRASKSRLKRGDAWYSRTVFMSGSG